MLAIIPGRVAAVYFCYMNGIKPIKRSKELQPLSREHHDGLLFVWKLKQGLDNHIPVERLMDYTGWYWVNHIKPHFFQEEKILLPFIAASHPMALQLKKEHEYIRELILNIDREPDRHDFVRLTNLLETHIRFEEREFFSFLEEQLSAHQLTEICEQLEKHPVSCSQEWKDDFWLKKKI
jgi:hemerythrin-like domain-containing protein